MMKHCYRCQSQLIDVTPDDVDNIMFFECPSCKCQYAKNPDGELHDRWLMPITLPLYAVISEEDPVSQARTQAVMFLERDDLDLKLMIEHIIAEIKNPKQRVSEIYKFVYPDEENLREYLSWFVSYLELVLNKPWTR